jgi:hypothetical protein
VFATLQSKHELLISYVLYAGFTSFLFWIIHLELTLASVGFGSYFIFFTFTILINSDEQVVAK